MFGLTIGESQVARNRRLDEERIRSGYDYLATRARLAEESAERYRQALASLQVDQARLVAWNVELERCLRRAGVEWPDPHRS